MNTPILCMSFDGVLHAVGEQQGALNIQNPPVPGALKWAYEATRYFEVCVFSSRSSLFGADKAMRAWMVKHSIIEFGPDHPMSKEPGHDEVYPIKFVDHKPAAFLTIDDRAITFKGDWSDLDPKKLLEFKTWQQETPAPESAPIPPSPKKQRKADVDR